MEPREPTTPHDYACPFTGHGVDLRGLTGAGLDIRPIPLSCGVAAQSAPWRYEHVFSPFCRLYFARHDDLSIRAGGRRHTVPRNGFLMIPAELHFHCRTAGSGEHLWIHFNLLPPRLEEFRQPVQLQGDAGSRALARELWRQLQAQPEAAGGVGRLHRSTHLAKALLHLLLGRLNLTVRPHLPTQLQHALETVHERLRQPLTVGELARLAGYSPEHLAHLFRHYLKQSPSAYMRAARIREAARRLAYSDDTIEAIAADLCFANRHHLSRVFKAVMREPPAAFRKRLRGRDA